MNLCPCGARGDPAAECSCSAARLAAYRDKLSRALLDRFDLVVTVPRPRARELAGAPAEGSPAVRERVFAARKRARGDPLRRSKPADELLSRAGMNTAEELGERFGLDVTGEEFWTASLDVIGDRIDQYEALAARPA